ncbi:MAG: hypothetical protein QOE35_640 [Actinomycetota bacterium]
MSEQQDGHDHVVSVIVTAGPGADLAIASARRQVPAPVEVLMLGGAGDTPRDRNVRVLSAGDRTEASGAARNRALQTSRGDFVVFLGPGERLLPGALGAGVKALEARPRAGFALGRTRRVSPDGERGWATVPQQGPTGDLYVALVRGEEVIAASAPLLYRRAAIHAAGGFDTRLRTNLDLELCLRSLVLAPGYAHGVVVAEHRAIGPDPSELTEALEVLRAQRPHLEERPYYRRAYRDGLKQVAQRYGIDAFERARRDLRNGEGETRAPVLANLARALTAVVRARPTAVPSVVIKSFGPALTRRSTRWRRVERSLRAVGRAPVDARQVVREAAAAAIPKAETALLFDDGAGPPLAIDGVVVRGFVPDLDVPAGAQIDAMRAQGASFLLIPSWMFWWLDHYQPELKLQLETQNRVQWSDHHAVLYALDDAQDTSTRALVAGFFSFAEAGATAGDLLARDVVCGWLSGADVAYDVAQAPPFAGGVDWRRADPERYTHLVFVCGPWLDNRDQHALIERFARCRRIGLNLSMGRGASHPFDVLLERDSDTTVSPDISLAAASPTVPVVGVCLRDHADGTRIAHAAIRRLLATEHAAVVEIDTRLDANTTALRSAAEVEALLARMDVVVTTRLHGMVLALKHGVPVVAVDPEAEGGKLTRQAAAIGWPTVVTVDTLTDEVLQAALQHCLTDAARAQAKGVRAGAARQLRALQDAFLTSLDDNR